MTKLLLLLIGIFVALTYNQLQKSEAPDNMPTSRSVSKIVYARETPEGVGVTVRRSIGSNGLRFSPFLMLDHFRVEEGSGFSEHPHRGFSTITYMLEGSVQHEDFRGHSGIIGPSDIQWMQAGRGVLHSEMPVFPGPTPKGLQLWVDLPKERKMDPPDYQEYSGKDLPSAHPSEDVTIKVLSGEAQGSAEEGLVKAVIKPWSGVQYLDITLHKKGSTTFQPLPKNWTSFAYVLEGSVKFGKSKAVEQYNTAVFSCEDTEEGIRIEATSDSTRLILLAGQPLDQPVAQMGPFIMTTQAELRQAVMDFQLARNGFENAHNWVSKSAAVLH